MRRTAGLLGAAVATSLVFAATAEAADSGFCRAYAQAAHRQVQVALETPRCAQRVDAATTRWSTDPNVHFRWCLGVSGYDAAAESGARGRILDHCRL